MVSYQSNLLISLTVFQIAFLEDIILVTNILCLIPQSTRKDFAADLEHLNQLQQSLKISKIMSTDLQNFKTADKIIQKLSLIEMCTFVSGTTRKKCKIDTVAATNEFHEKVIKQFITALVAEISQALVYQSYSLIQNLTLTLKTRNFRLPQTIL